MGLDASASPRLAMACWDYSWLTRRDGHHCEYRNLDQVFEELVERGYNALRIDPFPHLIAAAPNGLLVERFEVLPEGRDLRRGAAVPVQVYPRRLLVELLQRAKHHRVKLWLSSWFVPDSQARRSFVRRPGDFVRVWAETLEFIRREGFADQIVAVDFCHEFPMLPWAHGSQKRIFGNGSIRTLTARLRWSEEVEKQVEQYLLEIPRALRAINPGYLYGVSACGQTISALRRLDTTEMDFLDHHLWLTDQPEFRVASGTLIPLPVPALVSGLQARLTALLYRQRQQHWQAHFQTHLARHADFARVRRLLPVLAEGYVSLPLESSLDWDWVRVVSEQVVTAALSENIPVISPGIHARPHSPGFWAEIDWQQQLNARVRRGL